MKTRLTMALVASLCVLGPAAAAVVPPRQTATALPGKTPSAALVKVVEGGPAKEEFVMNDQTEIQLDGKACKYADVPGDAQITLLEVTKDRVILKIHFRSKK